MESSRISVNDVRAEILSFNGSVQRSEQRTCINGSDIDIEHLATERALPGRIRTPLINMSESQPGLRCVVLTARLNSTRLGPAG